MVLIMNMIVTGMSLHPRRAGIYTSIAPIGELLILDIAHGAYLPTTYSESIHQNSIDLDISLNGELSLTKINKPHFASQKLMLSDFLRRRCISRKNHVFNVNI